MVSDVLLPPFAHRCRFGRNHVNRNQKAVAIDRPSQWIRLEGSAERGARQGPASWRKPDALRGDRYRSGWV